MENLFGDEIMEVTMRDGTKAKADTGKGGKFSSQKCVNDMVNAMLSILINTDAEAITEAIMPQIKKRVEDEIGIIPKRIEVATPKGVKKVTGITHDKYKTVLDMVNLDIPVYLTGKAGTGKNVICKQVAEALGLDFYFTNAVTQEYKLTGFIDANGKYQETQFYKAFTKGGLFFLDEMDASVPETLVILNAAIANRYFDFPCGKVDAHKDFRVIAAGNTCGTGADINYTGRYSLDRASLDRFAMVEIDYSEEIENAVSNYNEPLVAFAHAFRTATYDAGVECLCSYRTIERIAKLQQVKEMALPDIIFSSLTKGLDDDTLNVINSRMSENPAMQGNEYANALKKIKRNKK